MFRRYHHGHSVGLGVLVGLLLTEHPYTLAAVAFTLGAAVTFAATTGIRLARTLLGAFELWRDHARSKARPMPTAPQPVYDVRPGRLPRDY